MGTLLILLIYALMPGEYRSSRALILLSAIVIAFVLNVIQLVRARTSSKSSRRRVAVVGSEKESRRVMELLNRISPNVEIAGTVGVGNDVGDFFLSKIDALDDVVREYRIDELIFSSSDIGFSTINKWMTHFGDKLNYRIASSESDDIVGSDSKADAGHLYTTRIEFVIGNSMQRRNKRLFDMFLAVVILLLGPVMIISSGGRAILSRAWQVALGRRTWVGYDPRDPDLKELPALKEGYVYPTATMRRVNEMHTLNYLYAREYSVWKDIELLMRTSK